MESKVRVQVYGGWVESKVRVQIYGGRVSPRSGFKARVGGV